MRTSWMPEESGKWQYMETTEIRRGDAEKGESVHYYVESLGLNMENDISSLGFWLEDVK